MQKLHSRASVPATSLSLVPSFLCIYSASSTWTQIRGAWSFGLLRISEWALWCKTCAGRNYCSHVLFSLNFRHSWVIWSPLLIYLYNFFNRQKRVFFFSLDWTDGWGSSKIVLVSDLRAFYGSVPSLGVKAQIQNRGLWQSVSSGKSSYK